MCAWVRFPGFEDDIVIAYCLSQLVPEEALGPDVDERANACTLEKAEAVYCGLAVRKRVHRSFLPGNLCLCAGANYLCPKRLAISLTGFVGRQATNFVKELWKLLLSAQVRTAQSKPSSLKRSPCCAESGGGHETTDLPSPLRVRSEHPKWYTPRVPRKQAPRNGTQERRGVWGSRSPVSSANRPGSVEGISFRAVGGGVW